MTGPASTPPSTKTRLLEELGCSHGPLRIGKWLATELAERFGTPLYVYDAQILRSRLAAVRTALGPRVDVFFALKANSNVGVAQVMRLAGAGAEVASAGEICIAERAGFAGSSIQFAGPGKDAADFEHALRMNLGWLNLESEAEYDALAQHARSAGKRPGVAIRVNPKLAVGGSRMRMGGGSKKFGIDEDEVEGLVRKIVSENLVELRGLHVYAGTQSFDALAWVENAKSLVALANRLEAATGIQFASLNFGGGFGVPCFEGDPVFDLGAAGTGLKELVAADARPRRRYLVELGRYLTGPSGVYLTRVVYTKSSQGKRHAILDGGMHQHGAAAGVGAVLKRPFPIVDCKAVDAPPCGKFTLGGPLCTPADELAGDLDLPDLEAGDVVAVLGSGAYGLTFSQVLFLSHPLPAEVLVDGDSVHLVRERGKPEDALHGQHLPADARC